MNDDRRACRRAGSVRAWVAGALLATAAVGAARADGPDNITPAEWSLLPQYCYYTQLSPGRNDAVKTKEWYGQLGQNFHSMHHYCWGLIWQMRAERERFRAGARMNYNFMLRKAIGEMQFTLERVDPTFRLRPEMLTRQGRVYNLMARHAEGSKVFQEALDQNPTYWPASVGLGEALLGLGRADLAMSVVDAALARAPGIRQLTDLKATIAKAPTPTARAVPAPVDAARAPARSSPAAEAERPQSNAAAASGAASAPQPEEKPPVAEEKAADRQ